MTIRDDLASLCRLEAQLKELAFRRDELRGRIIDHALSVEAEEGAAPTWKTDLGSISLARPSSIVKVVDEDVFAKYASDFLGEQAVESVVRVRSGVKDSIINSCEQTGAGELVDPDGVVVPGVSIQPKARLISVTLTREAKAAAAGELERETAA